MFVKTVVFGAEIRLLRSQTAYDEYWRWYISLSCFIQQATITAVIERLHDSLATVHVVRGVA